MAGIGGKRFTRQRFGYLESAAGLGEKAGPQASSSCDRSSTLVGDTTRKKDEVVSQSHNCDSDHNVFCYICSKFEESTLRKNMDDNIRETFKEIFSLEIDKLGIQKWVPNIICHSSRKMLNRWNNIRIESISSTVFQRFGNVLAVKNIVSFVAMKSRVSTLKIKTKLFTSVLHQ